MSEGDFFQAESDDLGNGSDFTIDPSNAGTGAVEIHNIIHDGDCDVKYQIDPDGDSTFEIDVTIDSFTGAGISSANMIELSASNNDQLVITNTSGSTNDYAVTGVEITD